MWQLWGNSGVNLHVLRHELQAGIHALVLQTVWRSNQRNIAGGGDTIKMTNEEFYQDSVLAEESFVEMIRKQLPKPYRIYYDSDIYGGWHILKGGFWIFGKTVAKVTGATLSKKGKVIDVTITAYDPIILPTLRSIPYGETKVTIKKFYPPSKEVEK